MKQANKVQKVFSHLSIQELLSKLEELGDQVPMEMVQAILAKEQDLCSFT